MNDMVYAGAFYALAGLTVLSAAGVVLLKDIVHSAFLLALTFVGVAGVYLLLNADYLAAVQVLIYGGAVVILIAFGVMLTRRPNMKSSNPTNRWALWGFLVAGATFATSAWAIVSTRFPGPISGPSPEPAVEGVARLLLEDFVVPFEAAAILLLVAMLGAIILAKGANEA